MLQGSLLTYHNGCTPLQHCLLQWLEVICCPAGPSHGAECWGAQQSSHLQSLVNSGGPRYIMQLAHAHRQSKCNGYNLWRPSLHAHNRVQKRCLCGQPTTVGSRQGPQIVQLSNLNIVCRELYLTAVFARLSAHVLCRSNWAALSCASAGSLTAAGA